MNDSPIPLPAPLAALVDGYDWRREEAGESGGAVHRLEAAGRPALYLKYGRGRIADDVADEAARLRWLVGRLPVPAIVAAVGVADEAWLLSTAIDGRTGDDRFEQSAATRRDVTVALAQFLRQVHALPIEDCPFAAGPPQRLAAARRNMDAGRVDTEDFDADHAGWSVERLWDETVALAPATIDPVVTHGDYSLGNVLFDDAGAVTGCIDLGRVGVADRYQDIAILWQNLSEVGEGLTALFLDAYGIGAVDERKLRFHRCLDEFF